MMVMVVMVMLVMVVMLLVMIAVMVEVMEMRKRKYGARLICNQGAPFVVFCAGRLDADHT